MKSPWKTLKEASYLWRTGAPLRAVWMYLRSRRRRNVNALYGKHGAALAETQAFVRDNSFRQDWFTHNIPYWMEVFERFDLRGRPIDVLEIGSFEGLSACFLLRQLPLARVTCVDTWAGSDEHAGLEGIGAIESAFDRNVTPWRDRVTKLKGYSFQCFASLKKEAKYDLIYVDGSHHADDVMVDALRGFSHLKVGGVMILDDYLWRYYPRTSEDPAMAINGFLRLIEGRYRLVMVYYQLVLVKTAEPSAWRG